MNEQLERLRGEFLRKAKPFWKKRKPLPPRVARLAAEYALRFAALHDPIEHAAAEMGVRENELRRWIRVAAGRAKCGRCSRHHESNRRG